MPSAGYEPAFRAIERQNTDALYLTATALGVVMFGFVNPLYVYNMEVA